MVSPPVILYHGSNEDNLASILENGLQPRRQTGKKGGNWSHKNANPSLPDMVYLSDSMAGYFAAWCQSGMDGRGLLVEVSVSMFEIYPDEDFIRLAYPKGEKQPNKRAVRQWMNLLFMNRKHTEKSLESIGTCAHLGSILPDRITRYALFERDAFWGMRFDNSISPIAYQFSAQKLRNTMKLIFDGDYEVTQTDFLSTDNLTPEQADEYRTHMGIHNLTKHTIPGLLPITESASAKHYELAKKGYRDMMIAHRNKTVEVVTVNG